MSNAATVYFLSICQLWPQVHVVCKKQFYFSETYFFQLQDAT